ncbi:type II CAAX endopeptidase family protein [Clostridium sp.]|uniref:CPBP family intramembrane glutamic endopeptidase n=1 Tax=Clostridium sp. TaxID=1506 RepID=UPI002844189C|nr:type II CAAX endopeptidase family protein [Clostridium sp.]MDR3596028.1 type II CAAX endopeptidase family protein [Clostridium sp.]
MVNIIRNKEDFFNNVLKVIALAVLPSLMLLLLLISMSLLVGMFGIDQPLISILASQSIPIFISFALIPIYILKFTDKLTFNDIGLSGFKNRKAIIMNISILILFVSIVIYAQKFNTLISNYYVFIHFMFIGISEEILSRGIIIHILSRNLSKIVSMIISSLIFAFILHSNEDILTNLIIRVPLGIILGSMYLYTKNLSSSILLHWFYDVVVVLKIF